MQSAIVLVGAGSLGRHHLAGLLRSTSLFSITIVDPSPDALDLAKKTAAEFRESAHKIDFQLEMPATNSVDLAIIATTSGHRAEAVKGLLEKAATVRYMILEKILFNRREEYAEISELLEKRCVVAWVNHPRRLYPLHKALKKYSSTPHFSHARGGIRYGLMTSVLHYADFFSYLNGSSDFETDISLLSREIVPSKREGYLELFGTLVFRFKNGSIGAVTSLPQHEGLNVSIASPSMRAELEESRGAARISLKENGWKWEEHEAPLLRQSDLTGSVAEGILKTGACGLPTYREAAQTHLAVLEPVQLFLKKAGHNFENYPFT
ncbi:MAG: Oxidoreductase domain-containing protein [Parcubacteria group bacterium GW2011_GWA2_51_10]|nr:MAG: Oxidoreductase domain-containing protein [Parcubacteria group bacterium GW2011_GWA2_51_10]